MKLNRVLIESIIFLYVLVFFYAGLTKLLNHEQTYRQMFNQPFDTRYAGFMSWFIPCLELSLCVLVFLSRTRKIGLWGSTLLMCTFTVYVGIIWFGRSMFKVPCSCGGLIATLDWPQHFWFNLTLSLLGFIAIILHYRTNKVSIA
ncbi:MauE/DoxX family redox-associated membrane protein [Chitinophaga sp. Hz27]|uniref:MauE/DoxX family redox-associated membrane protein n=1 Tax=Chitinophaga sp. Hz27 TaxID=3347169 RepID=UPI0035DEF0C9